MKQNTYIASKKKLFFKQNFTYIASNLEGNNKFFDGREKDNQNNLFVPLNIFCNGLSGLEAISKYLKDVNKLKYCEIAKLIDRDDRTVWGAYSNASKKYNAGFNSENSNFNIPLSIFNKRPLSILETLTGFLKEDLNLRYCEIASLINKDQRTVWTAYNRAKKKIKNVENS